MSTNTADPETITASVLATLAEQARQRRQHRLQVARKVAWNIVCVATVLMLALSLLRVGADAGRQLALEQCGIIRPD